MTNEQVFGLIADVPNFPKAGVTFKDITPIFESPEAFTALVEALNAEVPAETKTLAAIESRGFILAAAMAQRVPRKVVLLRKPGKLPRETFSQEYELEYGTDTLEVHVDSISKGEKVCIVDDILATGGTASAAEQLVEKTGGIVSGMVFMMELAFLAGAKKLKGQFSSLHKVE
ncbi:MAG: adenine phosphoribosyltransferase [Bdellovibrionales bacterium]|nr:adenine phosphoribosyltransferase [Bdellovibrionales bacterium]